VAGAVVLGVGIWIASDRHSFITVTRLIENEEIRAQVSNKKIIFKLSLINPSKHDINLNSIKYSVPTSQKTQCLNHKDQLVNYVYEVIVAHSDNRREVISVLCQQSLRC